VRDGRARNLRDVRVTVSHAVKDLGNDGNNLRDLSLKFLSLQTILKLLL